MRRADVDTLRSLAVRLGHDIVVYVTRTARPDAAEVRIRWTFWPAGGCGREILARINGRLTWLLP